MRVSARSDGPAFYDLTMAASSRVRVNALLFPRITQLDLTGPAEVFAAAGFEVALVWRDLDPVVTDGGWSIVPTHTFEDAPEADILLIPGGGGVDPLLGDAAVLAAVRDLAHDARWVSAVCTGSLVLAAAGLLEGRRATTHWASTPLLERFDVSVVHERWVRDGDVITAAGVSAGIDMALALVGEIGGRDLAAAAQLEMEYDPQPPFAFGSPQAHDPAVVQRTLDEVTARRGPLVDQAVRSLSR